MKTADNKLDTLIEEWARKNEKRQAVGLYSKLEIAFAVIGNDNNTKALAVLKENHYNFSELETNLMGIYGYTVFVDSFEDAAKLKKQIEKIK